MCEEEYIVCVEYPWSSRPGVIEGGFCSREEASSWAERLEDNEDDGIILVYPMSEYEALYGKI